MSFSATLSVSFPVSEQTLKTRDELVALLPKHKALSCYIDPYLMDAFSKELEATKKTAEQKLVALAKKAGLKPVGAPDLNYGFYGALSHSDSVEMWFQIQASD